MRQEPCALALTPIPPTGLFSPTLVLPIFRHIYLGPRVTAGDGVFTIASGLMPSLATLWLWRRRVVVDPAAGSIRIERLLAGIPVTSRVIPRADISHASLAYDNLMPELVARTVIDSYELRLHLHSGDDPLLFRFTGNLHAPGLLELLGAHDMQHWGEVRQEALVFEAILEATMGIEVR